MYIIFLTKQDQPTACFQNNFQTMQKIRKFLQRFTLLQIGLCCAVIGTIVFQFIPTLDPPTSALGIALMFAVRYISPMFIGTSHFAGIRKWFLKGIVPAYVGLLLSGDLMVVYSFLFNEHLGATFLRCGAVGVLTALVIITPAHEWQPFELQKNVFMDVLVAVISFVAGYIFVFNYWDSLAPKMTFLKEVKIIQFKLGNVIGLTGGVIFLWAKTNLSNVKNTWFTAGSWQHYLIYFVCISALWLECFIYEEPNKVIALLESSLMVAIILTVTINLLKMTYQFFLQRFKLV